MQHRLVRLSCWLGLLGGALLVGLHVLAVPTTAESKPNALLAAFDEVLQRVVSLRQLQPKLGCVVHSDMIQLLTKERKRLRWLSEGVISALTF